MNAEKPKIPLFCSRSGLFLGHFIPNVGLFREGATIEGMSPFVRNWKETNYFHPIFSLSLSALFHRAESQWILEKQGKIKIPETQKRLLFLALLHAGEFIVQTWPCLPSLKIADSYFPEILSLLAFKRDSARIKFPRLHISKPEIEGVDPFQQIPQWIKLCREVQEEYENTIRARQKEAKKKAQEIALRNIRRNLFEDISLRKLWNWIDAQLDEFLISHSRREELKELFFVAEKNINLYTFEEIDELEKIFLEHCELGNSISFEVQKRINEIREWLKTYTDTFEIEIDLDESFSNLRNAPAPKPEDFKTKAEFLIAEARWKLANRAPKEEKPKAKKISIDDL